MPSPSRNDSPTDLTIPRPPVSSGTEHHHIPTPQHRDRPVSPVPTVRARADSDDMAEATSSDDEAPMPTLTGALTGDPSISASALPQRTPLSLASWFSGQDDSYAIPHPSSTSACRKLQKGPTSPSKPGKSRFAFFSAAKASIPTSLPPSDDLLTIDVARCLAPDACSTDLHTTALRLLTRYQCAYRRQDAALSALQGSEAALREEAEEAEVRNRHLKKQLEEMARRVEEQEGTLRSLLGELVAERRMREEKARGKRCSKVSEDLGVGEREGRRWSGSSEGEGGGWGECVFEVWEFGE